MSLSELVEDMELYPRHAVDNAHVASLVLAMESGSQLPPIVADKKSKRITDGWHRARAYARIHGPTATVEVELIDYASEADMIFDAVRRNSAHGRKLDSMDQTRSIHMMEKRGLQSIQIAAALNVPEKRIEKLRIKVASSRSSGIATVPGTKSITLKRSCSHMAGKSLTADQVKVHDSAPGTSYLLVSRQLREALRVELVNLDDERLVEELCALRDALNEYLEQLCAA